MFAFKNNIHFFKTHAKENGFIITQYPPNPEEAVDFLRLLMDHDCSTIICLDQLHIIESVGVILYFSREIFEAFKSFQIEASGLLSNICTLKTNFRSLFCNDDNNSFNRLNIGYHHLHLKRYCLHTEWSAIPAKKPT